MNQSDWPSNCHFAVVIWKYLEKTRTQVKEASLNLEVEIFCKLFLIITVITAISVLTEMTQNKIKTLKNLKLIIHLSALPLLHFQMKRFSIPPIHKGLMMILSKNFSISRCLPTDGMAAMFAPLNSGMEYSWQVSIARNQDLPSKRKGMQRKSM